MGRNSRATRPLGFQVGECWGDILSLEPNTASTEAARYLYQNGGAGGGPMIPRLMVKFEEIETDHNRHAIAAERIQRAHEYGCDVQLCLDWHNKASHRNQYHQYQYWPTQQSVAKHVRDVLRMFNPAQLEVANEFWYVRGSTDMRMREYRDRVFEYVEGIEMANWHGLLVASTWLDARDSPHDLWGWDVPYDNCAEAYHHLILSNGPDNPDGLRVVLNDQPHVERGKAIGWTWPLMVNECSPVNNTVNLNTANGENMMRVMLEHHKQHRYPMMMLAMGGGRSFDAGGGEWGMQTDFVDNRGNLSRGVEEWLRFVGADPYEGPNGDPSPDPTDKYPGTDKSVKAMKRAHELGYDLERLRRDRVYQYELRRWHEIWQKH